ncbi:MAG: hypothetical protein LBT18_04585 [Endomicrobium sp.]|jgi:hypothetical protein|nr:hypothetical protein [Endomicrobium sp.]
MFYNKKLLFFVIVYAMSALLYYFVNKQLMLTGVMSGFVFGSLVIYGAVVIFCFIMSLILSLLVKYSYTVGYWIFKIRQKAILSKVFWIIFTGLIYLVIFIIFLKATEY